MRASNPDDQSEQALQAECYLWFHNNYPALRGLLSYNLGNSRNRAEGSRNRAMGLQKGRADMELNYQRRTYFFEFKLPGARQTAAQKQWQKIVEGQGFTYQVVSEFKQWKGKIRQILGQQRG